MPAKVLVADDSPTIRRRATTTLSEAGYDVTCVEDGQAAWNLLETGVPFTVLLCDILMPGLDGYELCRRVKTDSRFSTLPVLLLRGTFEPWDQAKAVDAGADGYITKPFDGEALLSTLGEVLADVPLTAALEVPAAPEAPPVDVPGEPEIMTDESLLAAPSEPIALGPSEPIALGAGEPIALGAGEPIALGAGELIAEAAPLSMVHDELLAAAAASPFGSAQAPPEPDVFDPGSPGPFGSSEAEASPLDLGEVSALVVPAPEPVAALEPPSPLVAPTLATVPATAPMAAPLAAPLSAPIPAAPIPAAPRTTDVPLPSTWDDAMIERLADRVAARLAGREFEKIAWDVVPDVAEAVIRKRLAEIEARLGDE